MKKRIKKILSIIFCVIVTYSFNFNYLNADEIQEKSQINNVLDIKAKSELYKLSSDDKIYLPFFRSSSDKIELDNEVSNFGIIYGNKGIEVNSKTQDLQILVSNDTVRVNENMEYAIIASNGNVIVDSNIDKTLVIFAGEKITITENATINKDVIFFSNSIEIKGNVLGSVVGSANNSVVSGRIEKDFRVMTQNIEFLSNDNVLGELFIKSRNSDIQNWVKDKYENARIEIEEKTSTIDNMKSIVLKAIKIALVYALAYLIFLKIFKEKIYKNLLDVISKNVGFSIISGTIIILLLPLAIMIGLLGTFIGIEAIVIPILILYIAVVLVISMLAVFIVGSVVLEYITEKYIDNLDLVKRLVCGFFVFLSMILLTNIPKVGMYINMLTIIAALGIVVSYIFKREKNVKSKKKK